MWHVAQARAQCVPVVTVASPRVHLVLVATARQTLPLNVNVHDFSPQLLNCE